MATAVRVLTEDLGKICEYALCQVLQTPFNGHFNYAGPEHAQRIAAIQARLQPLALRLAGYRHTGNTSREYDFQQLEGEGRLSVKTNKKARDSKICPQIIGQTTKSKFCAAFEQAADSAPADIKRFIQTQTAHLLTQYTQNTYHCPVLYYNEGGNLLQIITLTAPIDWAAREFVFSRVGDAWKESSTLKIAGYPKAIGEFQIHGHRDGVKFRFNLRSLLEAFPDNFAVENL
jgi:hypothetical protein